MPRNIIIPPAVDPLSQSGGVRLIIELIGPLGGPIPTTDSGNTSLVNGKATVVMSDTQQTISLFAQDELFETTYYRVTVLDAKKTWTKNVQLALEDGSDIGWAEFLGMTTVALPAYLVLDCGAFNVEGDVRVEVVETLPAVQTQDTLYVVTG
jgi:hypothetical protein